MSQQLPAADSRTKKNIVRVAVGAVTVPVLFLALSGTASAAEITPIAEYLDDTVASLSQDIIDIVTTLLS